MNDNDLRLLARVIREAQDLCDECDSAEEDLRLGDADDLPSLPNAAALREALDNLHLRFSVPVPL